MGSADTSRSINFALIGHAGDGKTTLADSLLVAAGVINRLGRVDDGTSFMNWLPEEKHRRASISTSMREAWPATTSSIELSNTSATRWWSAGSSVPPIYMPGRLRTGSSPSRTSMSLAV